MMYHIGWIRMAVFKVCQTLFMQVWVVPPSWALSLATSSSSCRIPGVNTRFFSLFKLSVFYLHSIPKRHNSGTNWHQGMKVGRNNSNKSVFTPDESWYPLLPVQLWAPWSLHPSWFDLPALWWNWIWALGLSWAWPQAMSRSVWGQPLQCQAFQHHIRPPHFPLLLSILKYGSYLMYFFFTCFCEDTTFLYSCDINFVHPNNNLV